MRNKDIVFILLINFWVFVGLGAFVFNECFNLSPHMGINAGAILFFIAYLLEEKYMPNFRKWSNFKL